jgi:predicted TIM-barrel fold metal-dependent hydrolase
VEPKIDCHVHVFDPERFPYADDTFYRPSGCEIGTASLLRHVMDAHGVRHALLVGPNSGYCDQSASEIRQAGVWKECGHEF